jgi:hypothetical protein
LAKSFSTLRDEVELELQDSANGIWTAAEVNDAIEDGLRELSLHDPYIVPYRYELETRTGSATSTTAGALVDATNTQFLATDVQKVIYNSADRTWTVVTAFVSTSQLTLAEDIMVSGEAYEMFNKDCERNTEIYLGNIEDFQDSHNHGVVSVEYPIGEKYPRWRTVEVRENILRVPIDFTPPNSNRADLTNRKVEVNIRVARKHQVSQNTDVSGVVDNGAGYSENDTRIHVDALADEAYVEDQEFTVTGLRGRYWLTASTMIASNEGDITFWPPLENALADNDVVTFLGSSLNRKQERILVELVSARVLSSKATALLANAHTAITTLAQAELALDLMDAQWDLAIIDTANARTASGLMAALLLEGNTALDKIAGQLALAAGTIDTARPGINTVPRGGPNTSAAYANNASISISAARTYLDSAKGYFAQATANKENALSLIEVGASDLTNAQQAANDAKGYLDKGVVELAASDASGAWESWANRKARRALDDLHKGHKPNQIREYSEAAD